MKHKGAITTVLALLIVAGLAGPAPADGPRVTSGAFHPFATAAPGGANAATYADLAGHARMVRTAEGKTIVTTHLAGLLADTVYGSHVHAAACSVGEANGHYKHDPAGAAAPPNEIWPAFTTNSDGVGNGKDTAAWTARDDARSVVVHAPGGAKIGCADLG